MMQGKKTVQPCGGRWQPAALLLVLVVEALLSPIRAQAPAPADAFGAPKLTLQKPDLEYLAGTPFELQVIVGAADSPVRSLFGISFELHYSSGQYLEFVPPVEGRPGPFLQPDIYTFTRHEPENKVLYLAVSRKRGAAGQNGFGLLLSLALRLADDAPEGWEVCFEIKNITANDSVGNPIDVQPGPPLCVKVIEPAVEVVPNPFTPNGDGFNDNTKFKRDGGIPRDWVIYIMDRAGRTVRKLQNGQDTWDGRHQNGYPMEPGIYLYTIRSGKRIIRRGLIGIVR